MRSPHEDPSHASPAAIAIAIAALLASGMYMSEVADRIRQVHWDLVALQRREGAHPFLDVAVLRTIAVHRSMSMLTMLLLLGGVAAAILEWRDKRAHLALRIAVLASAIGALLWTFFGSIS